MDEAEEEIAEYERKAQSLQRHLKRLAEEGDTSIWTRNHYIAHNEVASELGVFRTGYSAFRKDGSLKDTKLSDEIMQGLIVRTRTEGMQTMLNVNDVVDRLVKVEKAVDRVTVIACIGLGALIVFSLSQLGWW